MEPGDPGLTKGCGPENLRGSLPQSANWCTGSNLQDFFPCTYHAYVDGNDDMKMKIVRWFRGEYTLKREAKEDLGVSLIITDDDWYDYLKIFAVFFRLAGYAGMMIMIDELVNLYKIPNAVTRQ